jgi:hypothetical protein
MRTVNIKLRILGSELPLMMRIYKDDRHIAAMEYQILIALRRSCVPVPEVLYADADGNHAGLPYLITGWIDGLEFESVISMENINDINISAYSCGRSLALLGMVASTEIGLDMERGILRGPIPRKEGMDLLESIELSLSGHHLNRRLGVDNVDKIRTFVRKNSHYLQGDGLRMAVVHGDFMPHNLLIGGLGKREAIAWVIDWEFAHWGPSIVDIGAMLRSSAGTSYVFESAFIRGYIDHGGVLGPHWKRSAKLADLDILCKVLNQSRDRPGAHGRIGSVVLGTMASWDYI